MPRKMATFTTLEWFASLSTPDASRMSPFGFRTLLQNAIVHTGPRPVGKCRFEFHATQYE